MIMRMFLPMLAVFLFTACAAHTPERAFYWWKAASGPSADDVAVLDKLAVQHLYVRVFEIGSDGSVVAPISVGDLQAAVASKRKITPVVFIHNDALRRTGPDVGAELGRRMVNLVSERMKAAGADFGELQLDCDWTVRTRDNWFALLRTVRSSLDADMSKPHRVLSATIRLHQVSQREQTGVPPVDRGMLMVYNLQTPGDVTATNSILDPKVLAPYLPSLGNYPLPLDIALPVYSWVVQFDGQRIIGLISGEKAQIELADSSRFEADGAGAWVARVPGYLAGHSIQKGDHFRLEQVDIPLLEKAGRMIVSRLKMQVDTVTLFHLDASVLYACSKGQIDDFSRVYQLFVR